MSEPGGEAAAPAEATPGGTGLSLTGLACAVGALRGWRRLLLAGLAGAVLSLGHAPFDFPWTAFLALPVLVWLTAGAAGAGRAFAAGWGFGFGYFVVSLHWIGHAFLVEADQFAWMLPIAMTVLPGGLALFWGIAAAMVRRWRRRPGAGLAARPLDALALAAALTLVEMARSVVLTGLPWGLPAYLWVETPLVQMAAWVGPHGTNLLTLALAALPLVALAALPGLRGAGLALASLAAGGALWWAGAERLAGAPMAAEGPVVRIVQPNAPQKQKWDPNYTGLFLTRLLEGSAAPADPAMGRPAMVIWPETAVAFLPAETAEGRAHMARAAGGAPLVLGALHREQDAEGTRYANSLFVLAPDGAIAARYDKHHLVPFGEYVPFRGFFGALGVRQLAARGRFEPGPGPEILAPASVTAAGLPAFVPLICYEAIFPNEVSVPGRRAGWMLQITNDAWFGTLGGPQQHLAQARMRAIEQGLPMVRAANTGISAVVDAHGRVTGSLPLGTHGHIDRPLPGALPPTYYAESGDIAALLAALLLFYACIARHPSLHSAPRNE
ncbi:MAG: apolipoprotein N-acyltransferase [Pseudomonadota bacterium]